jgi:hypothetical protein
MIKGALVINPYIMPPRFGIVICVDEVARATQFLWDNCKTDWWSYYSADEFLEVVMTST